MTTRDFLRFAAGTTEYRAPRAAVDGNAVHAAFAEASSGSDKRVMARVDSRSLIYVDRNAYSVNSRLIGEQVEARAHAEKIEVWYAGRKWKRCPGCGAAGARVMLPAKNQFWGDRTERIIDPSGHVDHFHSRRRDFVG